ncbi:hypothetical protein [Haloquadratum walsbyi]|uniref:Uncharacterized protein n=1 Tax=Haloquadratum walsbyi J07HQW2 TaxID=1238425 RepID=U1NER5_9EURY|nr:hypothetical protein [Haloquadratum walsbyi]ERG95258.1 MAG: hypothetical protein J07HQW2_01709 [Haloquadratum walsbyi J07HQW2]
MSTNTEGQTQADAGFGTHGWILVGSVLVCLVINPGVIYIQSSILATVGIPYLVSLLILPLAPAAALGLIAV